MTKITIAIVGAKNIPGGYGGTETFVEELTSVLKDEYNFIVTCEGNRFEEDYYHGVKRIYFPAIRTKITIPIFNELIATLYLIFKYRKTIDLYYFLGPDTSIAAILPRILRKPTLINPDGVEWKRLLKRATFEPLYKKPIYYATFIILFFLEYLSCKIPTITIADSTSIKEYLIKKYDAKNIAYISYGARHLNNSDENMLDEDGIILSKWNLKENDYYLTVARVVAENNLHIELSGFKKSDSSKKLVIIGVANKNDNYTKHLLEIKKLDDRILLLPPIYNKKHLDTFRKNCYAYIHAYEVGGTNPSLLEQMLYRKAIFAYDVSFNREVLGQSGVYFSNDDDLSLKIRDFEKGSFNEDFKLIQKQKIEETYNWNHVSNLYRKIFNIFNK